MGPLSHYELRELLVHEEINENTPICSDTDPVWQPISDVEVFKVTGLDEPPTVEDSEEEEPLDSEKPRPWVRFWVRMVDYLLFAVIIGAILGIFKLPSLSPRQPYLGMIMIFLWAFVETFLLATWGTTPGKWLLRIKIRTVDGKKPALFDSLSRSLSVWFLGVGAGVPVLSIITMIVACVKLSNNKITTWDRKNSLHIEHKKVGLLRTVVVILFFLVVFFLMAKGQQHMAVQNPDYF